MNRRRHGRRQITNGNDALVRSTASDAKAVIVGENQLFAHLSIEIAAPPCSAQSGPCSARDLSALSIARTRGQCITVFGRNKQAVDCR